MNRHGYFLIAQFLEVILHDQSNGLTRVSFTLMLRSYVNPITERAIARVTIVGADRAYGFALMILDNPVKRIILEFPFGLFFNPGMNARIRYGRPYEIKMTSALAIEIPPNEVFRV